METTSIMVGVEGVQLQEAMVAAMAGDKPTPLMESAWGEPIDMLEFMRDAGGFGGVTSGTYSKQTSIQDREDGKFLPVYETEMDLKLIRAAGWLLAERVPMARALCSRLIDYTISRGFDWVFTCEQDQNAARRLNTMVEQVLIENRWHEELERETFQREVEDGEALLELTRCGAGIEFVTHESDELTRPAHTRQLEDWLGCSEEFESSWSFGVHTKRKSPRRALGYHLVSDAAGMDWDYVPAERMCHWKRNVRGNAKRGVTDYYVPYMYLIRADKVFTNTAEGAAIQAAIAYVVEAAPNTTKATVERQLLAGRTADGMSRYLSKQQQRINEIKPGTIRYISNGQKYYNSLLGSNQSQIYIQVMQAAIRLAGAIYAMPEGMLTGDYSNNNFASALVAESPFTQGRKADQRRRSARLDDLLWKVVRMLDELGYLKRSKLPDYYTLRKCFKLNISEPDIAERDRVAQVQSLQSEMAAGLVSKRTAANELGRDFDKEQEQIQLERSGGKASPLADPAAVQGVAQHVESEQNVAKLVESIKQHWRGYA